MSYATERQLDRAAETRSRALTLLTDLDPRLTLDADAGKPAAVRVLSLAERLVAAADNYERG